MMGSMRRLPSYLFILGILAIEVKPKAETILPYVPAKCGVKIQKARPNFYKPLDQSLAVSEKVYILNRRVESLASIRDGYAASIRNQETHDFLPSGKTILDRHLSEKGSLESLESKPELILKIWKGGEQKTSYQSAFSRYYHYLRSHKGLEAISKELDEHTSLRNKLSN